MTTAAQDSKRTKYCREYMREYRANNKDYFRKYRREYHSRNKAHVNARLKEWRRKRKEPLFSGNRIKASLSAASHANRSRKTRTNNSYFLNVKRPGHLTIKEIVEKAKAQKTNGQGLTVSPVEVPQGLTVSVTRAQGVTRQGLTVSPDKGSGCHMTGDTRSPLTLPKNTPKETLPNNTTLKDEDGSNSSNSNSSNSKSFHMKDFNSSGSIATNEDSKSHKGPDDSKSHKISQESHSGVETLFHKDDLRTDSLHKNGNSFRFTDETVSDDATSRSDGDDANDNYWLTRKPWGHLATK